MNKKKFKGFEKVAQEFYPSWLDEIKGKGGDKTRAMFMKTVANTAREEPEDEEE